MDEAKDTEGRSNALRAATNGTHDRLDKRIMATDPFASRANYGRFLEVQHAFHREIDALYRSPTLAALLPDLEARRRFGLIEQDLADLGIAVPAQQGAPVFPGDPDIPTALGWLFVAEGSNLGAASLLKRAAALELSET
jgi:heme oxygenase (biliverdin-IX-beta and delta-forming)